ncbi:synaptonemal complex central element protein 1-like [Ovis aries]|uniref:synaptonemal complex central element protein 1-like n=1 Tax=Ovis aries TaxID=9940 RepID=UPI0029528831|nr:synaptonemal complex central element protein 1-like [Ovis aries]
MLKRRLAWEIRALQSSKEQLLFEAPAPPTTPRPPPERQALARLEDVERRLLAQPEAPAARAAIGGLKAEPEKLRGEAPAQTQNAAEDPAGAGEQAGPQLPSDGDLAPPMQQVPTAAAGQ